MSVKILLGDVRYRMRDIPSDSVDCVVTSPPYFGLRSYLRDAHPDKHLEIGLERTLAEHIEVLLGVFEEVRRVLKPAGTVWLNYGDCYATASNGRSAADTKALGGDDRTFRDKPFSTVHGVFKTKDLLMAPNRLAIALQEMGWWVRSEIVWGKNNPMPDSSGKFRPSTSHEKIFLLAKDAEAGGWWVARDTGEVSATPDLYERVIAKTNGEKVPRWIELGHYYNAAASVLKASEATHQRLAQDVAKQIGSERANGGRKTNGNMKAVSRKKDTKDGARPPGSRPHSLSKFERGRIEDAARKQDGHSRRHDGFNERYFSEKRKLAEDSSGIRNNKSMDAALSVMPETRYLRNYEPAPTEVWEMSTQPFSEAHYATFTPELVERCLLAGCPPGGLVLDPFGGAGTVGLVADRMGCDAILIELNSESTDISERRLVKDGGMFMEIIKETA